MDGIQVLMQEKIADREAILALKNLQVFELNAGACSKYKCSLALRNASKGRV